MLQNLETNEVHIIKMFWKYGFSLPKIISFFPSPLQFKDRVHTERVNPNPKPSLITREVILGVDWAIRVTGDMPIIS